MTTDETEVSERAEAALKTNAEAYRLAQEAIDMRTERDAARAENTRLRSALTELIAFTESIIPEGYRPADVEAMMYQPPLVRARRATR